MARRTFYSTIFTPAPWSADQKELKVSEPASEECPRNSLRTIVTRRTGAPRMGFNAFNAAHDEEKPITAYADPDGDQDDPEHIVRRVYVRPRDFQIYEFVDKPGFIYATAPQYTMSQMLRRFKNTYDDDVDLNRRIVDLDCLEEQLEPSKIGGYKLTDVLLSSHVRRVEIVGQRLGENDEVQEVKARADKLRALEFSGQFGAINRIVRLRVTELGSVHFFDYPGDASALKVLEELESFIDRCDDMELINVRERR